MVTPAAVRGNFAIKFVLRSAIDPDYVGRRPATCGLGAADLRRAPAFVFPLSGEEIMF
jgi:hypothetical protein